jgi:putative transposase
MALFRNRYRIKSARCPAWNYSSPGYYFITVVTYKRCPVFGEIVDGEMQMNEFGRIVHDEWYKSFEIRPELMPDEFTVMPNHLHGIIRIVPLTMGPNVETPGRATLRPPEYNPGIAFRPPKSISSFVAGYKSTVTKRINELRETPRANVFQPRFHDHIIRDENELFLIRQYIQNNTANWMVDDEFNDNCVKPSKFPWYVRMP